MKRRVNNGLTARNVLGLMIILVFVLSIVVASYNIDNMSYKKISRSGFSKIKFFSPQLSSDILQAYRGFSQKTYDHINPLTVYINVLPGNITNYILIDCLPYGWTAKNISDNGAFFNTGCDLNPNLGYINWPLVSDGPMLPQKIYNYTAYAPESAFGIQNFSGKIYFGFGGTAIIDGKSTVNYLIINYTLNISKTGNGTGAVVSNPSGINCGSVCNAQFGSGSITSLNAIPDKGSFFTGWGSICKGVGQCNITMNSTRNIDASFMFQNFVVSALKPANGLIISSDGKINCGATGLVENPCSAIYYYGTKINLTAFPSPGYVFGGWTSDCVPSNGNTCTLFINNSKTVSALFYKSTNSLYVNKKGTGDGIVYSNPSGINCGSSCNAQFGSLTNITLTAIPNADNIFTGWDGPCNGLGNCIVNMNSIKFVNASFIRSTNPLIIDRPYNGAIATLDKKINCSLSNSSCIFYFKYITKTTLIAIPDNGFIFNGWSGNCYGTIASNCSLLINETKKVGAQFLRYSAPLY